MPTEPRTARSSVLRDYTSESCAIVAHRDTCQVQIVGNENNAKPSRGKRGCNFHRRVIDRLLFRPFNFMRSRAAYVNRSLCYRARASVLENPRMPEVHGGLRSRVARLNFKLFFFLNKNHLNRSHVNHICFSALRRYHRY